MTVIFVLISIVLHTVCSHVVSSKIEHWVDNFSGFEVMIRTVICLPIHMPIMIRTVTVI